MRHWPPALLRLLREIWGELRRRLRLLGVDVITRAGNLHLAADKVRMCACIPNIIVANCSLKCEFKAVVRIGEIRRPVHALFYVIDVFASEHLVGSKGVEIATVQNSTGKSTNGVHNLLDKILCGFHTAQLLGQQLGARSGAWLTTGDDWKDTSSNSSSFQLMIRGGWWFHVSTRGRPHHFDHVPNISQPVDHRHPSHSHGSVPTAGLAGRSGLTIPSIRGTIFALMSNNQQLNGHLL